MEPGTVIDVANDLLALVRRPGFDPVANRAGLAEIVRPFVAPPDELERLFLEHGIKRPEPPDRSRIIFYSPELLFQLSRFGTDFRLPTHNHGAWNFLLICRGEMHFRWYRRLDDRTVPGRADLELVDDLTVRTGEIGFIAPPPHDIHELEITEEDTWMLTVQPQDEPPLREIYDPAAGTYEMLPLSVARDRRPVAV